MAAYLFIFWFLLSTGYCGLDPTLPVHNPCPGCTSPGNRYPNYVADYSGHVLVNVSADVLIGRGDAPGPDTITASLFLSETLLLEGVILGTDAGNCPSVFASCEPYVGFTEVSGSLCSVTALVLNPCMRCALSPSSWASFYSRSLRTFPSMSTPGPTFAVICLPEYSNTVQKPCRDIIPATGPCDTTLVDNPVVYSSLAFGFARGSVVVSAMYPASTYSFSQYFAAAMAAKALPTDFLECPLYSYANREFIGRSCHQYPVFAAKSIAEYVATGSVYIWLELRAKLYMSMYAKQPYLSMLGKYCPTEVGLCYQNGLESYFVDNAYIYSALWRQQRVRGGVPFDEIALFGMLQAQHDSFLYQGYYVHSVASDGVPTYLDYVLNINLLGAEVNCVVGHDIGPGALMHNLTDFIVGNYLRYDLNGRLVRDSEITTAADYIPFVLFSTLNLVRRGCINSDVLKIFPVLTSLNPSIFTSNTWALPFVYTAGGAFSNVFSVPFTTVPFDLQLRMYSNPKGFSDGYAVSTPQIAFQTNNGLGVSASMRATILNYTGFFCSWNPHTNSTYNRACMALSTPTFIVCSLVYGPKSLVQYDDFYVLQTQTAVAGSLIGPGGSYFTRINSSTSYTCVVNIATRPAVVSGNVISGFVSTTNGSILLADSIPASVYKPWYACGASNIVLFQPFNVTCTALPLQATNVPAAVPEIPAPYQYFDHLYKTDPEHYFASGFKYVQFPLIAPPFCHIANDSDYFDCPKLACGNDSKCLLAVSPLCSGMQPILYQIRKEMDEVTFTLSSLSDDFFSHFRGTAIYRPPHESRGVVAVAGFIAVAFVFLLTTITSITLGVKVTALSAKINVLQQQLLAIDLQVRALSSQQIELAKIVDDRTITLATAVNSLSENLEALSTSTASNFAILSGSIGDVSDEVQLNRYLNAFSTSYLSTASATLSQLSSVYVSLLQHKQILNACAQSTFSGVLSTACVPLSSMATVLKGIQVPAGCQLAIKDLAGYYSSSLLAAVTSLSSTPYITVAIPYNCNVSKLPYMVYPRHFSVNGSKFAAPPKICFKGTTKWLAAICSGGSCIPSTSDCEFDYVPTTSSRMALFTYLKNVSHPCTVYSSDGTYFDACDSAVLGLPTYGTPIQAVMDLQTSMTFNGSVSDLVSDLVSNMTFPDFNTTVVAFRDNLTLLQQQMADTLAQYEDIMAHIKPVGNSGLGIMDIILLTISCFAGCLGIIIVAVLCCCSKRHRD